MARTLRLPAGAGAAPRASKRLLALRGDDHLVGLVRQGSEAAFEVVYERHVAGILSFCRHMLGSREEAEDAVQHAFAAAHRDLLRDEREIRLKPWLYAIARNRCLSMLRARREQADDALDVSTEGLDNEVQRRAELRELVADLQDLPEDQRAALVLTELRDLSHADVAEALGCQVANVKGLVFRARSGLIERREARGTTCEEIQQELATARGGALRRGKLRHHLSACSACCDYLGQVRAQRKMMALILPVVPTLGLKKGVLAAVGIGGGASGGGGAAAGGGLLASSASMSGATVAKVAVVGALVGGAGVAGEAVLDRGGPPARPPSIVTPTGASKAPASPFRGTEPARASERSGSARAGERRDSDGAAKRRDSARKRRAGARKMRRRRARGRVHADGKRQPAAPVGSATPTVGQAKPKKARGNERSAERPAERAPVRARPESPSRERPAKEQPATPKPVPQPKEKMEPAPAPAQPPRHENPDK